MVTFRQQLSAWKSVIFALFLRELQSKFNDKLGLSWAFVEPFIFIFFMSAFRGLIHKGDVHGVPLFHFMMIGMLGIQTFLTALGTLSTAIKRNKPLYAFRQVQPMAALISSAVLEISIKLGVIALMALALYAMDNHLPIADPMLLIFLFVTLWLFSISLCLIFSVISAFIPEFGKVKNLLTRPLFFISCVFFSMQDVPEQYWPWLNWNPLVHFIELARFACYESYGTNGVSIQYVIDSTVITMFFALSVYHITWKRILAR